MDCSLPGCSVIGILQARILEWVAVTFSRRCSQPRNQTWVSCIAGRFLLTELQGKPNEFQFSSVQFSRSVVSNSLKPFFTVQLSHPYMTTGKAVALTRRTFVVKVMSLLLNMLSRLAKTFLPRSKRLLISWLQSPSAVILEPQKIKSDTVSPVSPSISHEVTGPDAMIWAQPIKLNLQGMLWASHLSKLPREVDTKQKALRTSRSTLQSASLLAWPC